MQKTRIALFPLEMLLLPGESRELHIFEDRYKKLIQECEALQLDFGIPFNLDGTLTGYGAVVELVDVIKRYPDGSKDIVVRAKSLFKLYRFYLHQDDKPYPGGTIEKIRPEDWPGVDEELVEACANFLLMRGSPVPPELVSAHVNALDLAKILDISDADKLAILQTENQYKRETVLKDNLAFLALIENQKNSLEGNLFLN